MGSKTPWQPRVCFAIRKYSGDGNGIVVMIEIVCYIDNNTDLCLATQLIGLFLRGGWAAIS